MQEWFPTDVDISAINLKFVTTSSFTLSKQLSVSHFLFPPNQFQSPPTVLRMRLPPRTDKSTTNQRHPHPFRHPHPLGHPFLTPRNPPWITRRRTFSVSLAGNLLASLAVRVKNETTRFHLRLSPLLSLCVKSVHDIRSLSATPNHSQSRLIATTPFRVGLSRLFQLRS